MLISLHGFTIEYEAPTSELEAKLARPFALFVVEQGSAEITIEVIEELPPYDDFPALEASYSTPRNVVYDTKDLRIVDYFGKGATVEDKARGVYRIYGEDHNFLQEAIYLLTLSIFGQYCDRSGMLRVHAMALSYGDKAILMPIPPGGGKSTMAVAMLKEEGFKLISDDEPVVSSSGSILPFALRIGTLDKEKLKGIPEEFIYCINRMEFGQKYFIDVRYWEKQLEHRALEEIIYVSARRVLNRQPSIRKIPKYKVMRSIFRDAIIGVGLYQGLEFMLGHSVWTTVSQAGTVIRRSIVAWKMISRASTYQLTLSRDIDENRRVFSEFIRSLDQASG